MNKVMINGRLTREPEIRNAGEMKLAKFTVAVQRGYKKDEADFIGCTAFGKTAEFLENYTSKGDPVLIEGHIQTGSYNNKDGKKVYTTDVIVDRLEKLPTVKKEASEWSDALEDEGLPFE